MEEAVSSTFASLPSSALLVNSFHSHYARLERAVSVSITNEFGDSVVLARIRDDLDEFLRHFQQVSIWVSSMSVVVLMLLIKHAGLFSSEETNTICQNVLVLLMEV